MRSNSNIPYNCLVLFILLLDCTKTSQQQWVHRLGSYQKNYEMIVILKYLRKITLQNVFPIITVIPKGLIFFFECQLQVCFLQKLSRFLGIKIPGCKSLAKVMGQIYNNQYIIINRINEQNHLIQYALPQNGLPPSLRFKSTISLSSLCNLSSLMIQVATEARSTWLPIKGVGALRTPNVFRMTWKITFRTALILFFDSSKGASSFFYNNNYKTKDTLLISS